MTADGYCQSIWLAAVKKSLSSQILFWAALRWILQDLDSAVTNSRSWGTESIDRSEGFNEAKATRNIRLQFLPWCQPTLKSWEPRAWCPQDPITALGYNGFFQSQLLENDSYWKESLSSSIVQAAACLQKLAATIRLVKTLLSQANRW